jgi:hypothetical protein
MKKKTQRILNNIIPDTLRVLSVHLLLQVTTTTYLLHRKPESQFKFSLQVWMFLAFWFLCICLCCVEMTGNVNASYQRALLHSNSKVIQYPRKRLQPNHSSVQVVTKKAWDEKYWYSMTSLSKQRRMEHKSRSLWHHKPSLHAWSLSCTLFGLANWQLITRVVEQ